MSVGAYRDVCPFCGEKTKHAFAPTDAHGRQVAKSIGKARELAASGQFASATAEIADTMPNIKYLNSPIAAREARDIVSACAPHLGGEGRRSAEGLLAGLEDVIAGRLGAAPIAPAPTPQVKPAPPGIALRVFGALVLIAGVCLTVYFLAVFDVSVPVDYSITGGNSYGLPDRVNNIGLISDRQNGIIIGVVLAAAGGVIIGFGEWRRSRAAEPTRATSIVPCPACSAAIPAGSSFCPSCGAPARPSG